MKSNKELNAILDDVTGSIRSEAIDSEIVEEAAGRVWSRIKSDPAVMLSSEQAAQALPAEHIESCSDFQSLIPAYLNKELSEARTLLLEDHTHECIPCRRALKTARSGRLATVRPVVPGRMKKYSLQPVYLRWGIAAVLVLGFGLLSFPLLQWLNPFGGSMEATVQAAEGQVYRVDDTQSHSAKTGDRMQKGESLRTAKDAHAVVRLGDGSAIEMKDRSEFSVTGTGDDTTIHLNRGQLIVQAAKRKSGHLYVDTGDSLVSVTGTTFSVNNGTKGTRVSVIEGEVHLDHANKQSVLRAGEQGVTHPSLAQVPVREEIAWSRDAARYTQTLAGLASLNKELNSVPRPGVRTSTRLLDLVPEGTVLYAALPNLSETLNESHRIMQERIRQNPALRQWWERENSEKRGPGLDLVMAKVREFGERLGDEIAVSAGMDASGKPVGPLVLARVKDPQEFRSYLEQQAKLLGVAAGKNGPSLRFIDDPSSTLAQPSTDKTHPEILVWIHDDILAASPNAQQLQQLSQNMQASGANSFTATPFYSRIAEIYREGAGLVVAADLEKIIAQTTSERMKEKDADKREEALKQLGLLSMKYFVLDQKEIEGKTQSRAVLSFTESQHGISSWLAAPGPMGSLEYISRDANVVAGFVVKDPVALVDDLLGVLQTASPNLVEDLKKLETEHGLNLRNDFAAPLGGEFAFAIDGPILPTPSWKLIFEVNDPAHLQQAFEHVVDEVNKQAAKEGKAGLQWEKADIGGRTFYTLKSTEFGLQVNYAFVNGYMVAAPTRALIERAINYHDSGVTLLNSNRFTAGLPSDGNTNFSALVYHNLAPLVQPIAERMGNSANRLPEEQQQAWKAIADSAPTLAYAYAQGDRVTFAANTEGGPFGLSPATLLGMPSSFQIQHIMQEGMRGGPEQK
ncbi:MAG TPA: FecR domain-containing protein [Pyrinomonadaceae bacterium]|jgi:hypothetical protein